MKTTPSRIRDDPATDIYEQVENAHERIDGMLESLVGARPEGRKECLLRVARALRAEQRAEERWLYSRLDPEDPRIGQGLSEHRRLERLLEEVATLDAGSRRWGARARSLAWTAELHFQYEESEVFEVARHRLEPGAARELGSAFLKDGS